MNPAEVREQRLGPSAKMPLALADLHWHLENELTWLHLIWKEYKTLYATNERRVHLLNATAPNFFVHFEDMVWRDVMLNLCCLTDPPKSMGKDTLTVLRLPDAVDDAQLKARIQKEAEVAVQAAGFARDWRNRLIAHRSLDHVLNPQLKPLATAGCSEIENAFATLRQVMNSVSVHYDGRYQDFEGVVAAFSGAQALLYFLSSGLEAEETRKRAGVLWSPPHW